MFNVTSQLAQIYDTCSLNMKVCSVADGKACLGQVWTSPPPPLNKYRSIALLCDALHCFALCTGAQRSDNTGSSHTQYLRFRLLPSPAASWEGSWVSSFKQVQKFCHECCNPSVHPSRRGTGSKQLGPLAFGALAIALVRSVQNQWLAASLPAHIMHIFFSSFIQEPATVLTPTLTDDLQAK